MSCVDNRLSRWAIRFMWNNVLYTERESLMPTAHQRRWRWTRDWLNGRVGIYLSPVSLAAYLGDWTLQALHETVPVVFSERNGYRRFPLRIGRWRIGVNRHNTKPSPVQQEQARRG